MDHDSAGGVVKFGVIARSEARGLGNQSHEVCRNLDPVRVLLVDPGPDKRFTQHPERYAEWDTTTVVWRNGRLDEQTCRRWLAGLDVVYAAETAYDERLPYWANDLGVTVVVHANPEFLSRRDMVAPVQWWVATPWRLAHLPAGARVVPMPAPAAPYRNEPGGRVRFLHVAGWPAVADRNGTGIVAEAAQRMVSDTEIVIRGQHRDIDRYRRSSPNLRVESGNLPDYWDLYQGVDVLVMPRRFGGLCLPALEAMAVGMPVVMPDVSPNEVWPGPRHPAVEGQTVATRAGLIPLYDTDPHVLAETLDELASNRDVLDKHRQEADEWHTANSWPALTDLWRDELAKAAN